MKFQLSFILLISVFFSIQLQAQLCTGSLGDPVVNIDFGSGVGRGPALGSAITAYTYVSSGRLDEGQYTIFNATTGLRDTAWHTTSDHTGNTNGYMMIVNASLLATEGIFYTKTVTDLCPGTTYEFSAWLMNVMNFTSVNPNVTFRVSTTSGTVLGTYNSGQLPVTSVATWKQFGFYFTTGTESEVVITILNNALGAIPGNDLALDDITFRACGSTVTSAIDNESVTNLEVCEDESKTISLSGAVTSSSYTTPGYQWQTSSDNGISWTDISGANTQHYDFTTTGSGTYKYRLAVAEASNIASSNCRVFSNVISIIVKSSPLKPTFNVTQPTCDIPSGTIAVTPVSNVTYSIDDVNYQISAIFSGLAGGNYNVTVKSGNCVSAASVAVISSFGTSSATPTATTVQPVICTNPFGTITVTSLDSEYSFDNGLTWQTSPIKTGLNIGEYLVKTRNVSLCQSQALTVKILAPPGYPPTPTVIIGQPDCRSDKGTITVADTAAAYSFDGGANWGSSNSISNLVPGTYKVLIKNTIGCSSLFGNDVYIIAYSDNEPLPTAISPIAFCEIDNKTLADIAITGKNIKWYDALTFGNLLPETTVLTSGTYYASQTVTFCESIRIPVIVSVQVTPSPTGVRTQNFCTTQNATINFLTVSGSSIKWYDNAINGTVLAATTALVNGTTYYASQTVNGCESVNRLAVSVAISAPTVVVNDVSDYLCDDLNDGIERVDLSTYKTAITADASTVVRFYSSLLAAQSQNSASEIVPAAAYNLATGITTLYARIDSNDKCYQVAKLVLTLFASPVITIADTIPMCESTNIVVDAGAGFDSYVWSTSETTQKITVGTVGDYEVTVTKNNGPVICSTTKKIKVVLSNGAVISSVDIVDWTDNQNSVTINLTASSQGNYEYSIDGQVYQDSNTLGGLLSGTYTVYVRDKNGCGVVSQEVYILNYPKFFTPNGDGYNDTWAVQLSKTELGLKTEIFDRYGKLIKVLSNLSTWDGTYNGRELPSTDYWFVVHRANGKVYKGHFAMIR